MAARRRPDRGLRLRIDAVGHEPLQARAARIDDPERRVARARHVDGGVQIDPRTGLKLRTDISATLFLSDPDDYDGGELEVADTYGSHSVKLSAGDLVLYPATSLHHVRPVTRGARVASFFWIQSMVRDDARRTILFDLDVAIQRLNADHADHPSAIQLTGVYHNLLRQWAEV